MHVLDTHQAKSIKSSNLLLSSSSYFRWCLLAIKLLNLTSISQTTPAFWGRNFMVSFSIHLLLIQLNSLIHYSWKGSTSPSDFLYATFIFEICVKRLHLDGQCYELNVCILPKFTCWSPSHQCSHIWRWGFWEVIRFRCQEGTPMELMPL